jgi:hypothetical protein
LKPGLLENKELTIDRDFWWKQQPAVVCNGPVLKEMWSHKTILGFGIVMFARAKTEGINQHGNNDKNKRS